MLKAVKKIISVSCFCRTILQVTFSWEPPIIDGGATVFEHEITYSVKEAVKKDKYSKQEDVVTPADPVLTSR